MHDIQTFQVSLDNIRYGTRSDVADARECALLLVPHSNPNNNMVEYCRRSARDIITAAVLHLGYSEPSQATAAELHHLLVTSA